MRKGGDRDIGLDAESSELRELIQEAAVAEGFPSFQLSFGEDSTAAPALFISFFVNSADTPSPADLQAAKRLRTRVESALFEHGVSRVPYIRFREAPKRVG